MKFPWSKKKPAPSYQTAFPDIWVSDNLRRWLEVQLDDLDEADWKAIRKLMEEAAGRLEDRIDAD